MKEQMDLKLQVEDPYLLCLLMIISFDITFKKVGDF
jgi:hypothetical protein